jgi:hypothetical protein
MTCSFTAQGVPDFWIFFSVFHQSSFEFSLQLNSLHLVPVIHDLHDDLCLQVLQVNANCFHLLAVIRINTRGNLRMPTGEIWSK